jgi:recombination DNA repair RAD52 pathway protein
MRVIHKGENMSERDSNPSFDDTGDTAPGTHKTSDHSSETAHSYFIPVVILIVLCVTIVSTFYSKEFNNLIAGVAPPDQADELDSEVTQHPLAKTQAIDEAEDMAKLNTNTESAPVTEASLEAATAAVETTVADSTLTTADTPTSETTAEQVLTDELNSLVSMKDKASYSDRKNSDPYPYTPPMNYGIPQQHQDTYNEMMEQRRSLYEEAIQERREHRMKMREYRAEVNRRIEQDRLDMHKRMQEIEQEHQRRLDQRMNWIELEDKRSINRPI